MRVSVTLKGETKDDKLQKTESKVFLLSRLRLDVSSSRAYRFGVSAVVVARRVSEMLLLRKNEVVFAQSG